MQNNKDSMSKSINILDKEYTSWVRELCHRYRRSQIKAAVKVNQEMIRFYWELGCDIESKQYANTYGSGFYAALSRDMRQVLGGNEGFSPTTIKYSYYFYRLYSQYIGNLPQVGEIFDGRNRPQVADELNTGNLPQLAKHLTDKNCQQLADELALANRPQPADDFEDRMRMQVAEHIMSDIFSVPWDHHRRIIDKCSDNPKKALFFVHQTVLNGWSRSMLLNFLGTDLYERQGKAMTNFSRTLPDETSDLAQELTKDPYCFAFTGITISPSASANTNWQNSTPRRLKARYRRLRRLRAS